ncbi:MAG: CpaF family protein [Chloroflexi bacterium]|nr:CpaF family protein [Chloroflexota bacterium]MBU1748814.1 CpaF family protein [Chloroflexota bacterium]
MSLLKRARPSIETPPPAVAPVVSDPARPEPASRPVIMAPEQVAVQRQKHEMLRKLRQWLVERILTGIEAPSELERDERTLALLHERFATAYASANVNLPAEEMQQLREAVINEIVGYGPIEPFLADETISEIMVNGPDHVFVEQEGMVHETEARFEDDAHVMRIIDRIIRPLGRYVNRKSPMVDARLPDGSRVNVIIPPSAIDGPTITIRKFSKDKLTVQDLINYGSLTDHMSEFLRACVVARLNIVVSGGTGSGKTTLLNVLSNFIPDHERIVTIEDSAELQLAKPHVVRLEARPPDPDGTGRVTIRDLVTNSLRMRPERIVVGEVRDGAALDMLQAMNTGHDGSLTTLHANTPRDALSRLETMTLMAGIDFPIKVIREQVASAIDLIVQQTRLRDGSRKIVQITEVQGMEGDIIVLQDVFRFIEKGVNEDGKVIGELQPTGTRPKFTTRLQAAGFDLPPEIFGVDMHPYGGGRG